MWTNTNPYSGAEGKVRLNVDYYESKEWSQIQIPG